MKYFFGYNLKILGQTKILDKIVRSFIHLEHVSCPATYSNG